MPYEVTRQLDRQLQALSLLSVDRVLEGIEAYREHGRAPMPTRVTKARQDFERQVVRDLKNDYGFSDGVARERVADVVGGLVVLHESDQVTYGPGGPGVVGGYPSLGADGVNGSIGGQNRSAVRVLEEACRGVDPRRRAGCRLLIRAVLTDSAPLAGDLRSGRLRLEARSVDQQRAVSPRAPPWTPGKIAADIHAGRNPTDPPPPPPRTEPEQIEFSCTCSRGKVSDMLLMLGAAEVGGVVAEQGSIEVDCDFCHAKYVFDETDVNALFGADIVDTARQEIRRLQ